MKEHHIWCNLQNPFKPTPAEDCPMCNGLYEEYPYPDNWIGDIGDILQFQYFPNVIKRT